MDLVRCEETAGVSLARIEVSRLTADVSRQVFGAIAAETPTAAAVLLDFAQLEMIDSTGIGELVQFGKQMGKRGIPFVITGLHAHLMDLMRMMHLDSIMDFNPDLEQGIARLRQQIEKGAVH